VLKYNNNNNNETFYLEMLLIKNSINKFKRFKVIKIEFNLFSFFFYVEYINFFIIKSTFSGIQPTSIPHIGNYFGAIKLWIDIQNKLSENESLIISIVDLHALTLPKEPKLLNDYIYKCAATLMSCGLNPAKTILYQQSQVNKMMIKSKLLVVIIFFFF